MSKNASENLNVVCGIADPTFVTKPDLQTDTESEHSAVELDALREREVQSIAKLLACLTVDSLTSSRCGSSEPGNEQPRAA